MKVVVLGAGALGGYYGGCLLAAGTDVAFIARGAQLDALRTRGLRIESPGGNVHIPRVTATNDPAAIGPVDVVFFAVKLYDTDSAIQLLPPLIGPETVVIPFQNGIESVELLTKAIGRPHVAGGTAYVTAAVSEPGVIRHTAMNRLIFGELDGSRTPRLERLLDACRPAVFSATLTEHIDVEVWSKFVHLATFSGMTAAARSPVGSLRDDPDAWAMWQAGVLEAMAVARAKGVALPPGLFDTIIGNIQGLPPEAKSSMLQDLERGRPLELPWLSGAVVRMGREVGVETPTHRFVEAVLKPHVGGIARPAMRP